MHSLRITSNDIHHLQSRQRSGQEPDSQSRADDLAYRVEAQDPARLVVVGLRLEREVAATFACLCRSDVVVIVGEVKKVVGVVFEDEKVVLFGEA